MLYPLKKQTLNSLKVKRLRHSLVDPPGFEPGTTEPKSAVLPLHHGSNLFQNRIRATNIVQEIFICKFRP